MISKDIALTPDGGLINGVGALSQKNKNLDKFIRAAFHQLGDLEVNMIVALAASATAMTTTEVAEE